MELLTLESVKETTTNIFEGGENIIVPMPPVIWKDKLAALEEANLSAHRSSLIFDMRCWQAKEIGFQQIEIVKLVEMLMGKSHTSNGDGDGTVRQTYEWAYDHHADELLGKDWGGNPTIFKCEDRKGFWHLPPFSKKLIWEVQVGKLNYLKREIPYGVVLRINECKKLKLFNCFNVLAPMEAWERKTDVDPIVVASIWELPTPAEPTKGRTAGQVAHFFLAQW